MKALIERRSVMVGLLALLASAWGDCDWSRSSRQPLQVTLEVAAGQGSVIGTLVFKNVSHDPVHIGKVNGCLGDQVVNDVFVIRTDHVSLEYMLPKVKRLSRGLDDYYKLNPGESVQTKLNLGDAYQFLEGEHEYSARYEGIHGSAEAGEKIFEVSSNEVRFKHRQVQISAPDDANP